MRSVRGCGGTHAPTRKPLIVWKSVDWSAPSAVWAIALLSFLARVPNSLAGLGFDGDSGLYVSQALLSAERGVYLLSRPPGYFVPDLLAQLLAGYGSHWLCLLNSALYTFSVPVFASIVRALEVPKPGWLIWAYAFAPLGWVACSDVMVEYGLSLLGLMLGWLYTLRGAPGLAGCFLGSGAAMRPSQGIFIFLIFVVYWWVLWGGRRGLTATAIGLLCLFALWAVPVASLVGRWEILWSYLPYEASWQQHLLRAGGRIVGAVGGFGLIALVLVAWEGLTRLRLLKTSWKPTLLCLAVSGIVLLLFLRHPYKMNYLLLAVPFGLVGAALLCRPPWVVLLCSAWMFHNIVGIPSLGRLSTRQDVRLFGWGIAVRDYIERRDFPHQVESLALQTPPQTILGVQEPTVWLLAYETLRGKRSGWYADNPNEVVDATTQRRFILIATPDSAERCKRLSQSVALTSGAWFRLQRDFGYDARRAGFRVIETANIGL